MTAWTTFDGLDNRKTIFRLFKRLGHDQPERVAGMMRAGFLQGLIHLSTSFIGAPLIVEPCGVVQSYHLFVAICTCLSVDIEEATKLLEEVVAHGKDRNQEKQRWNCLHNHSVFR